MNHHPLAAMGSLFDIPSLLDPNTYVDTSLPPEESPTPAPDAPSTPSWWDTTGSNLFSNLATSVTKTAAQAAVNAIVPSAPAKAPAASAPAAKPVTIPTFTSLTMPQSQLYPTGYTPTTPATGVVQAGISSSTLLIAGGIILAGLLVVGLMNRK